MARLLRDKDYDRIVKAENLEQIIDEMDSVKLDMEQTAQEEMISYLKQRYIVDQIFTNTTIWSQTVQYYGKNLVEYTEDDFEDTATYAGEAAYNNATAYTVGQKVSYLGYIYTALGSTTGNLPTDATKWNLGARAPRVNYKGSIYQAKASTTGSLPTDTDYWTYVCEDLALFHVKLPTEEWDKETTYAAGDIIWYLDKQYTAVTASKGLIPSDYPGQWGTGVTYQTSAGVVPDNTTIWTAGDNRNQLIVTHLLDATLYHLLSRMPRNFSDVRKERYDGNGPQQNGGAIGWLKRVAGGTVNANLPEIITDPKRSIISGNSRPKQRNQLW